MEDASWENNRLYVLKRDHGAPEVGISRSGLREALINLPWFPLVEIASSKS
jgi:hypothetical protein